MTKTQDDIPSYQDIVNAARCLDGVVRKTPLLQNSVLNEITGANVYVKPENLQVTGSFKFRGAYHAISRLSESQRRRGVVAHSSGNHAQGIALAAKLLGVPAAIVMPADAPKIKMERTKRSGARIITHQRADGDRDNIARELSEQNELAFIHPYNNSDVIAGQGTVGLEIAEQLLEAGRTPERVLVCTGGGGLTSGLALAISQHFPQARIHSVEPVDFDDYRRSLIADKPVANAVNSGSICDAILAPEPGEIGFQINRKLLAEGLVVSDENVLAAVKFAFNELKLVVEPGGAAALAALLGAGKTWADETIVCVITGGNIDAETMAQALSK